MFSFNKYHKAVSMISLHVAVYAHVEESDGEGGGSNTYLFKQKAPTARFRPQLRAKLGWHIAIELLV